MWRTELMVWVCKLSKLLEWSRFLYFCFCSHWFEFGEALLMAVVEFDDIWDCLPTLPENENVEFVRLHSAFVRMDRWEMVTLNQEVLVPYVDLECSSSLLLNVLRGKNVQSLFIHRYSITANWHMSGVDHVNVFWCCELCCQVDR